MSDLKTQICDALAAWIRQRPGLDFGSYVSPGTVSREQITEGRRAYYKVAREIAMDKRDAETILIAVRNNSDITAEMILDAAKHSFSGRLEIKVTEHDYTVQQGPEVPTSSGWDVTIDYREGQYWPTEYRKAAAAVLAGALWSHMRDNLPESSGTIKRHGKPDIVEGVTPGDWLRNRFRKEFGSKLQRRWFN